MICRAEQDAVMLISSNTQALIPARHYALIERVLTEEPGEPGAIEKALLTQLESQGFIAWMREHAHTIHSAMERSAHVIAPENAYAAPLLLNIELTTRCPLKCPQCYCDLHRGKDISLERAVEVLHQAAGLGVAHINLSGGETMVYPHLYELIKECSALGLNSAVALSGYGVDERSLRHMIDCGIGEIYVSLNGSTEAVSRHTRDGHALAVRALELLFKSGFAQTAVNWVAHSSNIHDFENVAALCARLHIKKLVVIAFKPDAAHSLPSAPDENQVPGLAADIKRLVKELPDLCIEVESCYSPLRAYLNQTWLMNLNTGIQKGCGAGRDGASLDVDGNFTPCRHLDFPERFDHLRDYWYASDTLTKLRNVEKAPEPPCAQCKYSPYCLSCLAVGVKLEGRIAKANSHCSIC